MSNIHGFGSNKNNPSANNNNENNPKNTEEFSVGGGSSSTAVLRPNNGPGREGGNVASDIIKQARELKDDANIDRSIGLITLYSNGFIIGNGEFRDSTNNPTNQAFLADLKRGEVPNELELLCRKEWGSSVDAVKVDLVDKSSETYVPPKPKFDFAQSKGQSIASNTAINDTKQLFSNAKSQKLTLDSSKPSTTVQIILSNRQKFKEIVNLDITILQLYQHIMALANTNQATFELVAGFPPKPLTNPNQTIKEAGLSGAQIQQR
jgi:UBX domain-containing protein 1